MSAHEFGGDWTSDKLERVRKYLNAYMKIFTSNERARMFLFPTYVDAFAGTGYRTISRHAALDGEIFPELAENDNQAFLKGSARIALEVQPPFKEYIFIEQDQARFQELERLKAEFPSLANRIRTVNADANAYLLDWCNVNDWRKRRAVIFLDPYGMQVEWSLIEAIAQTKGIDLWLLFPLGIAVSRLLTRNTPPPEEWAQALTRIFGTENWKQAFYPRRTTLTLWGEQEEQVKEADFEQIGQYFVQRLKTVFTAVAENPLPLFNSKNNPLYLLCFASGNPRGSATAVRIAQDILRGKRGRAK
jgi:three-Cys-motif partner protein